MRVAVTQCTKKAGERKRTGWLGGTGSAKVYVRYKSNQSYIPDISK